MKQKQWRPLTRLSVRPSEATEAVAPPLTQLSVRPFQATEAVATPDPALSEAVSGNRSSGAP